MCVPVCECMCTNTSIIHDAHQCNVTEVTVNIQNI